MSNLRDELFHGLVSGTVKESDGAAWRYDAIEAAAILDGLMPTIDRALAGERAAALGEAEAVVADYGNAYPTDIFIEPPPGEHGQTVDACSARALRAVLPNVLRDIRALPRRTPASDGPLAQVERSGYARGQSDAAEAFSAALRAVAPKPNQWRATWPPDEALREFAAQARREQREKDARIARPVDEVLADIILAQED